MWYFTWVLGAGFACAFAILNAMWLEIREPVPDRFDVGGKRSR